MEGKQAYFRGERGEKREKGPLSVIQSVWRLLFILLLRNSKAWVLFRGVGVGVGDSLSMTADQRCAEPGEAMRPSDVAKDELIDCVEKSKRGKKERAIRPAEFEDERQK